MERHILRERTSSHIPLWEPGGADTCTPLASLSETPLIGCMSHARLRFSALCPNLTAWFSSRDLLPVTHLLYQSALIVLPCLLIPMWQLVKVHRVTRNEPKIHGIFYITECILPVLFGMYSFSLGFLKFLCIGICWLSFIKSGCFFPVISFFPNCNWLPENSTFGYWFGLYAPNYYFYMGSNKVFIWKKYSEWWIYIYIYIYKNYIKEKFMHEKSMQCSYSRADIKPINIKIMNAISYFSFMCSPQSSDEIVIKVAHLASIWYES